MSEFTHGIYHTLKSFIRRDSFVLALISHVVIVIAMTVVSTMTGASPVEAGAVALVEPNKWRMVPTHYIPIWKKYF